MAHHQAPAATMQGRGYQYPDLSERQDGTQYVLMAADGARWPDPQGEGGRWPNPQGGGGRRPIPPGSGGRWPDPQGDGGRPDTGMRDLLGRIDPRDIALHAASRIMHQHAAQTHAAAQAMFAPRRQRASRWDQRATRWDQPAAPRMRTTPSGSTAGAPPPFPVAPPPVYPNADAARYGRSVADNSRLRGERNTLQNKVQELEEQLRRERTQPSQAFMPPPNPYPPAQAYAPSQEGSYSYPGFMPPTAPYPPPGQYPPPAHPGPFPPPGPYPPAGPYKGDG